MLFRNTCTHGKTSLSGCVALGELFVLLLAGLCVLGVALLAVGGQQAAAPTRAVADYDGRALVVRALERVTWNEEQDFEAQYRSLMIRETEFREELRRRRAETDDAEKEDDDDEFVFAIEAEEPLRGRPSYRVSFRPRHGRLPIRRRIDYALNKARGQVWIDQETFEAARVEFELIDKVRLWWGVLGTISQARGSLDRGPVLGAIWAQLQFETYTDIRAFLSRTRRAELKQWRDFGLIEE